MNKQQPLTQILKAVLDHEEIRIVVPTDKVAATQGIYVPTRYAKHLSNCSMSVMTEQEIIDFVKTFIESVPNIKLDAVILKKFKKGLTMNACCYCGSRLKANLLSMAHGKTLYYDLLKECWLTAPLQERTDGN